MVTTETRREQQTGKGNGNEYCPECPRCNGKSDSTCPNPHAEYSFRGLHPVCKVCRHCVLNGKHADKNLDNLDKHRDGLYLTNRPSDRISAN